MSIYFDNAASSPVDPRVAREMYEWQLAHPGNPSSVHQYGQKGRIKIENVRDRVAGMLHCRSKEILFTSGGTEANNLAIRGLLAGARREGKTHILISATEHPSVYETVQTLSRAGFTGELLPVPLDPEQLRSMLRSDTALVSVMMVNNETGIIHPVQEMAVICHEKNIPFHCDAVQAFGKMDIDLQGFKADLLSFSAHKIHGPKGIGGLFVREGLALEKITFGGGQEANRRPGTENLCGIIGLGAALEQFGSARKQWQIMQKLQQRFEQGIQNIMPQSLLIGAKAERSPYISNVAFPGIDNQSLLLNLDMRGLAASVGSACSSGSIRPSRIISAMGFDRAIVNAAVRFSFGRFTTENEIDAGLEIIEDVIKRMRTR